MNQANNLSLEGGGVVFFVVQRLYREKGLQGLSYSNVFVTNNINVAISRANRIDESCIEAYDDDGDKIDS